MRLPDRARLVLHRLIARRDAGDPEQAAESALARIDLALREVRRASVDALGVLQGLEGERDRHAVEGRAARESAHGPRARAIEARLTALTDLRATLAEAEADLHQRATELRAALEALRMRRSDAAALAAVTAAVRTAEERATEARGALRELRARAAIEPLGDPDEWSAL